MAIKEEWLEFNSIADFVQYCEANDIQPNVKKVKILLVTEEFDK